MLYFNDQKISLKELKEKLTERGIELPQYKDGVGFEKLPDFIKEDKINDRFVSARKGFGKYFILNIDGSDEILRYSQTSLSVDKNGQLVDRNPVTFFVGSVYFVPPELGEEFFIFSWLSPKCADSPFAKNPWYALQNKKKKAQEANRKFDAQTEAYTLINSKSEDELRYICHGLNISLYPDIEKDELANLLMNQFMGAPEKTMDALKNKTIKYIGIVQTAIRENVLKHRITGNYKLYTYNGTEICPVPTSGARDAQLIYEEMVKSKPKELEDLIKKYESNFTVTENKMEEKVMACFAQQLLYNDIVNKKVFSVKKGEVQDELFQYEKNAVVELSATEDVELIKKIDGLYKAANMIKARQ